MRIWNWIRNLFSQKKPAPAVAIPTTSITAKPSVGTAVSSLPPVISNSSASATSPSSSPGNDAKAVGVDISHYEDVGSWTLVAANYKFCFMKASQALDFVDPKFGQNWKNALISKVPRGAYHVIDMKQDPVAQAKYFLGAVGVLQKGDMLAVDWEGSVNSSTTGGAAAILNFCAYVKQAAGITPFIYSSYSAVKELKFPEGSEQYPLWLARYGVSSTPTPEPWSKWTLWQYTDSGKAIGIGNCDMNYFNGNAQDFQKFINS